MSLIAVVVPITFKQYAKYLKLKGSECSSNDKKKIQDIEEFLSLGENLIKCLTVREKGIQDVYPYPIFLGSMDQVLGIQDETIKKITLDDEDALLKHCIDFVDDNGEILCDLITDLRITAHCYIDQSSIGSAEAIINQTPETLSKEIVKMLSLRSEYSSPLPKISVFTCNSGATILIENSNEIIFPFSYQLGSLIFNEMKNRNQKNLSVSGYPTTVGIGSNDIWTTRPKLKKKDGGLLSLELEHDGVFDEPASPIKTEFIFSKDSISISYSDFPIETVDEYTTTTPTAMIECVEENIIVRKRPSAKPV